VLRIHLAEQMRSAARFAGTALVAGMALAAMSLASTSPAHAGDAVVTNTNASGAGSLSAAITTANSGGGTITFAAGLAGQTISISGAALPAINANVTIDGSGAAGLTISGANTNRVFFVQSGTVAISNLTIAGGNATGGAGGSGGTGGGGGMGAGGAIFVNAGTTTISNVSFTSNTATGGHGGAGNGSNQMGGGGGGGLGGAGGNAGEGAGGGGGYSGGGGGGGGYNNTVVTVSPGGGGTGPGGNGGGGGAGPNTPPNGGAIGSPGTPGGTGGSGGTNAGGGGGGGGVNGGNGNGGDAVQGGGGGGGVGSFASGTSTGSTGGNGGDFGGGGGNAGHGGYGGGGGGDSGSAGTGGFGGGGGAAAGGTGGGTGVANGGGGGGAAFGGAVFVRGGTGAQLVIADGSFSGSGVTAGTGGGTGTNGAAAGQDLFLQSGSTTTFAPTTSITISTAIADDSSASLGSGHGYTAGTGAGAAINIGDGTSTGVVTFSAANTFAGGITFQSGTLSVSADNNLGAATGGLTFAGGTLETTASFTSARSIALAAGGTVQVDTGTLTLSGVIADGGTPGMITKTGAGTLVLSNANTYSGGTVIYSGTLQLDHATSGTIDAAGSNAIGVTTGGTLELAVTGTLGNAIEIGGVTGGTIAATAGKTATLTGAFQSIGGNATFGSTTDTGTVVFAPGTISPGPPLTTLEVAGGILQAGTGNSGLGTLTANSVTTQIDSGAKLDFNGNSATVLNLQGAGTLSNGAGATTTVNSGAFSGVIAGGGALEVSVSTGPAVTPTLTLSGVNTYTGATTVDAGATLALSGAGAIAHSAGVDVEGTFDISAASGGGSSIKALVSTTTSGQVNLGANTLTLTAAGGVYSGTLGAGGDTGGFAVLGGTATLNNVLVNYSGGTTIGNAAGPAATLAVTGAGGFANSIVTVDKTGTLDLTNAFTTPVASLAGSGGVVLGSYGLVVMNGSTTFSGVISGGGGLEIIGGTQTLTGVNTYGDSTQIDNGAMLALKGNGSIANSSNIAFLGTGTFDISQTTGGATIAGLTSFSSSSRVSLGAQTLAITVGSFFNGVIQDGGIGGGTGGGLTIAANTFQQLGGTNTYTGATTVNGSLEVDGSIATSSLTTVNANGALYGIGAAGAVQVNDNGTFAPGGNPGTFMTVSSLSMAGGAFYQVLLDPTTSTFANVTGAATLGGATVEANFASGSYVAKQYTILNAGSISGMFNPTVANTGLPSGFHDTLSYNANDTIAYLNLVLSFTPPPGSGLNTNQQNVGNAIINFFNSNGSIPLVFGGLTPAGLTQISGETATGSQQTTFDAMNQFMGVLTDPFIDGRGDGMSGGGSAPTGYASTQKTGAARDANAMFTKAMPAAPTFDQRWSVWAAGYGGSQTTSGNTALGSNDTTSRVYGTAVGADYRFSPFTIAGFALAGGGTSFSVANGGTGRSDLFQAGAFIRHNVGPAYITAALAYGWQDVTTNRTVTVAGTDMLQARFNANAWSGRLEGGYRYATPWMGITPYGAAQFTTFELPAYAESVLSGAGTFALAYAAKSVTDTRSELGIRTDKSWALTDSILTLRSRFAWAHDYDPDRSIGATFQALPGASFVVNGAAQAHDSALTTASAEIKWINGWSAAATFEGEFSSVTSSYAGKGVVRYAW
jgi:uncharacterized protein with beta-barrel porin domain